MLPLDDKTLRASFVNASKKERADIPMPDLTDVDWDALDMVGWRDPKAAKRAYVVVPTDDGPVGILLRQADVSPTARAQCSWCQDVRLPNEVVFYSAKKAGASGKNGNTVGTLVCSAFECSANVRNDPPPAYLGYDVEAARNERIATLRERAAGFAASVTD